MSDIPINRCRLILSLPLLDDAIDSLKQALSGGDVASILIAANGMDDQSFSNHCKALVGLTQESDIAAIVVGDTRITGRVQADGILVESGLEPLKEAIARFSPHKIVGCGGMRERHTALEAGESNPDFMFFGNVDRDIRPEPHRKNLALAHWWSPMIEIPCAVMGGNSLDSAVDVALSGAEFVVLSKAVFDHKDGPAAAVGKVNELLDQFGPKYDEE